MLTRCVLAASFVLVAGLSAGDEKKVEKTDKDRLQGEWAVVTWEGTGFKLDKEKAKNSNVVIKDDTWQPTVDGKKMIKLTAKLDPAKPTKTIDLTLTQKFAGVSPPNFTMKGIYKIEGDTVTVCRTTKPEVERPTDFKVAEYRVLIVLKRVVKK